METLPHAGKGRHRAFVNGKRVLGAEHCSHGFIIRESELKVKNRGGDDLKLVRVVEVLAMRRQQPQEPEE